MDRRSCRSRISLVGRLAVLLSIGFRARGHAGVRARVSRSRSTERACAGRVPSAADRQPRLQGSSIGDPGGGDERISALEPVPRSGSCAHLEAYRRVVVTIGDPAWITVRSRGDAHVWRAAAGDVARRCARCAAPERDIDAEFHAGAAGARLRQGAVPARGRSDHGHRRSRSGRPAPRLCVVAARRRRGGSGPGFSDRSRDRCVAVCTRPCGTGPASVAGPGTDCGDRHVPAVVRRRLPSGAERPLQWRQPRPRHPARPCR